jgi:cytidine deaminase
MITLAEDPYQESAAVQYFDRSDALPQEVTTLIRQAIEARQRALARFSGFMVGAALQSSDNQIFRGSNWEPSNADTICAERSAVCVARDAKEAPSRLVIRRLAIVGGPRNQIQGTTPLTPCGRCRQFLLDFEVAQKSDIQVICATLGAGPVKIFKNVGILLPSAFGEELPTPAR